MFGESPYKDNNARMCVFVCDLVSLRVHVHRAWSELDGLILEDVAKAESPHLQVT